MEFIPCGHCGDQADSVIDGKYTCADCFAELTTGKIPPSEHVTGNGPRCLKMDRANPIESDGYHFQGEREEVIRLK